MADGSGHPDPRWVDETRFKDALSHWASGVAVATCMADGVPWGLTVSSFTSLSLFPPRVLFCLNKANRSSSRFLKAETAAINVLSDADDEVARRFSGQVGAAERFSPSEWDLSPEAPPRFRRSLATFEGRIRSRIEAGSHDVVIIDVKAVDTGLGRPLLYHARGYRRAEAGDVGQAALTS